MPSTAIAEESSVRYPSTPMGRRKLHRKKVTHTLPEDVYESLRDHCDKFGVNASDVIEDLLRGHLKIERRPVPVKTTGKRSSPRPRPRKAGPPR